MSKIEWTDKTWNVITGCTQVSPACQNCYAKAMTKRLQGMGKKGIKGAEKYEKGWDKVVFHYDMLDEIFDKKKYPSGCKVFVNSMSDTFHKEISHPHLKMLFNVMEARKDVTFQILTKRAHAMWYFLVSYHDMITPNMMFGVTAENQEMADLKIKRLVMLKKDVKRIFDMDIKVFVSCEPLLESIDLSKYIKNLDWIIVGGERANKKGRVMEFEWVKGVYEQCKESNTPFFFKQWGDCELVVKEKCKGDDRALCEVIENTKEFFKGDENE